MQHLTATVLTLTLVTFAGPASAGCGIEAGSVRILSNDFEALGAVIAKAQECAGDGVEVTSNATIEHAELQVPALSGNPAEYTVKILANDSIVPLLNEGLLRPLDDLVAAHGAGLDPSQLIRVNGEVVAIAFMANAQHLTYRADLLEAAGLAPPVSYEEVLAAAQVLRDKGLMGTPLGLNLKPGWDLGEEFVNMYLGYGGQFFAPGSAELALDPEKAVAALTMLKELSAYMPADFLTFDTDTLAPLYQQGRVGLMNMWGSRASSFLGPDALPEVAAHTVFAAAPTVGGGTVPATTVWWDGFSIARNISDADAEASFRAMLHGVSPDMAMANPDLAVWLIRGIAPGPVSAGVIESVQAGAAPYPMVPQMGVLHGALGSELADFMAGKESADQALADVKAAYDAAAREQGFLR
jgi:ABC-type glycerol-3-phosphate transport system substrate-binding protein